ncbi:MAG TPA: lysylphosphatidylglycerol synthase transmembrane domain-containing protein [Anaerolineales bacterium]|nr:lysylphosphatidylglycerol synthase transmembrane domain-containing protein [Anaerolineales bacterium]
MRKVIVAIILLLAVGLVIFSFSEIQSIAETWQRAHPWYLALALSIQGVWFFVLGWTFQAIYWVLGIRESKRRLVLIAAASSFVSIVTPSAGVGGLALFVADGRARGLSTGKITLAGALYILLDQAAFLCVLACGLVVLIRRNNLGVGDITASLILLTTASVLAFLLFLGYRSEEALGEALARLTRLVNRVVGPFIHRDYLSEAKAHTFAHEISEGLSALPERPRSLLRPFLLSIANKVLLMGVLVCSFLSFDVPFTAGTIVGGFAIGYLFLIVSPTPSGIGVVEGVMALALRTLRVQFSDAVLITLAYRGITFWLPLAIGALAFRVLQAPGKGAPPLQA